MSDDLSSVTGNRSTGEVGAVRESSVRGIGVTAVQLSKNPLGIIALFIVLVYAIAGLVVAFGQGRGPESIMGMAFIVVFPLVVLGVFYLLVTRHHMKLYDPSQIVQNQKLVDAWIETGRFAKAITREIADEKNAAISSLKEGGLYSGDLSKIKAAFYIGEWTSRRMAADRAIFRRVRQQGLDGFRQATLNGEQYDAISRVFDFLEEVSLDLNNGSVDSDIIYNAMGSSIRRAWEKSKEFIQLRRAESSNNNFMINLENAFNKYLEQKKLKQNDKSSPVSSGKINN